MTYQIVILHQNSSNIVFGTTPLDCMTLIPLLRAVEYLNLALYFICNFVLKEIVKSNQQTTPLPRTLSSLGSLKYIAFGPLFSLTT